MEKVKLKDVAKVVIGISAPKNFIKENDFNAVPFIRAGLLEDLCNGKDNFTEYLDKGKYKVVPKDTVIFAKSGMSALKNRVYCLKNESVIVGHLAGIICNNKKLYFKYLEYYLKHNKPSKLNQNDSYPSIRTEDIENIIINLPEIKVQRKIAENLDYLNNIISVRKKQIEALDELIKSKFVEMFGINGKQVPLTEYVWFQEGPGVRSIDFSTDGTILLTGSNINENAISFGYKSDRFISNELANGKYAHFMCDKDDVLVVSSAIDPDKFDKKVVIVDIDKKYCLNTGIIRFKPDKQYLTLGYFREFLKTDYFKHQVISEMRGIAQMHFGPSHLKKMNILLPDSIELQNQFEDFVKLTDKQKFEIQKSLEEIQKLQESLMNKYFGG